MRLGLVTLRSCFLFVTLLSSAGCLHGRAALEPERTVLVSLQNVTGHDVCAVHLWSDDDDYRSVENRLLPGAQLLEKTSAFRLHDGSRRDFTLPAAAPLRMEAVDCEGRLVESREIRARAGSVVSLALVTPARG